MITENNSENLYAALKEVLNTPQKLQSFREEAAKRGEYFSLSNTMRSVENILDN